MWARISELILAAWLIISHFLFAKTDETALIAALFIILFSLLSFKRSLNKMHLAQFFVAKWLISLGFSYPELPLSFGQQNHIIVALLLIIFAIIPSHASKSPEGWEQIYPNDSK